MLTYTPFDSKNSGASCSSSRLAGNPLEGKIGPINVGETERYGSILAGAALVAAGVSRRGFPGLLLAATGGLFITRGLAGHCRLYESIGVSTAPGRNSGVPDRTGHKIEKSIFITRPPGEIFRFWRSLENLPEFMQDLESVRMLDDRRSHWVLRGPGGQQLEWDAEIVNEHPGEMISWQTLPGAEVQSAGTVRFTPAEGGRSTQLRVVVEFHPPGGELGVRFGRWTGKDPEKRLEQDLARLKRMMESRESSTVS